MSLRAGICRDCKRRGLGTSTFPAPEGAYRGNELPGDLRATLVLASEPNARRLGGVHLSFMAGTPSAPAIPGRPGPGGCGTGGVSNG